MKTFRMAAAVVPFASMGIGGTTFLVTKAVGSFLNVRVTQQCLVNRYPKPSPRMASCNEHRGLPTRLNTAQVVFSACSWLATSLHQTLLQESCENLAPPGGPRSLSSAWQRQHMDDWKQWGSWN